MTDPMTPGAFRERFALATFADGGLVVDLATGNYSRLNATAAVVLSELARMETTDLAVREVARRFHIPPALAEEHVASLVAALEAEGRREEPIDSFRYRASVAGGYDLWHGTIRALHVDGQGQALTLATQLKGLPLPILDYLSAIAPKVLFLHNVTVLHGAGWARSGTLLGICGRSRAGKTTTARMLAKHAGYLFSEDLLVLDSDLTCPSVFVGGEDRVNKWSIEASRELQAGARSVSTRGLIGAASGPAVPLRSLWFLDASRRGESFRVREVGRTDALALITANQFLGAVGPNHWRRYLGASHAIAGAADAFELAMPDGLDRLDSALKTYTTNSAS